MPLIDTHCHLNFKAFDGGQKKIIKKALDVGVSTFIVPGTDIKTSELAVKLASEFEGVFAVTGVHPHHVHNYSSTDFDEEWSRDYLVLQDLLKSKKVVGVGEIGLDKHTYFASRHGDGVAISDESFNMQKKILLAQLELARECGKSVVIHNREAKDDLVAFISENRKVFEHFAHHLVFHCCEAEEDLLRVAIELHFYIGVDGDVTYDGAKQSFIREVPLEMLVLETDSPYILPEPLKSQKKYPNTPSSIPLIAQAVAEIKNTDISQVAELTTQNAMTLFGLTKI